MTDDDDEAWEARRRAQLEFRASGLAWSHTGTTNRGTAARLRERRKRDAEVEDA